MTLSNLTTLLENVDWYNFGGGLWIPLSKLKMTRQQYHKSQYRQSCWELYLNEAPFPCWKRVAAALYYRGHLEELEIVHRKYLKGESAVLSSKLVSAGCYGGHCTCLTATIVLASCTIYYRIVNKYMYDRRMYTCTHISDFFIIKILC